MRYNIQQSFRRRRSPQMTVDRQGAKRGLIHPKQSKGGGFKKLPPFFVYLTNIHKRLWKK